jgi:hypothetical protein
LRDKLLNVRGCHTVERSKLRTGPRHMVECEPRRLLMHLIFMDSNAELRLRAAEAAGQHASWPPKTIKSFLLAKNRFCN